MATSEVQTVSPTGEKMRLALAVSLVIAGLVAFYMLSKQGVWVQWAVLVVSLAAALAVFLIQQYNKHDQL
jgi:preprotein translocase subunit SecE